MRRAGESFARFALTGAAVTLFAVAPLAQMPAPTPNAPAPKARDADKAERRARAGNLVGHGGPVKAIFALNARHHGGPVIATGSFDYSAIVWENGSSPEPPSSVRFADHDGAVNAVSLARVPRASGADVFRTVLLTAGDDGILRLWDRTGPKGPPLRFEGHRAKIVALDVFEDGEFAATASWDTTARIWPLTRDASSLVLRGHRGPVNGVAFSRDGKSVFTASADGQVGHWDAKTGELKRMIYRHGWGLNVLKRLPNSDHLLIGALNGQAFIIDGASGDLVRELPAHDRPVLAAAVIEKPGLIATGGGDGVVRVMRAADGHVLEDFRQPTGPVWALAFNPEGDGLYLGGLDDFVTLWKFAPRAPFEAVDTSQLPRRFQLRPDAANDATPEQKVLAAGALQFARKCSVCHTLTPDGGNRAGPTLHRVFGRKIATLEGYPFSAPLKTLDIVWDDETIAKLFELGPDKFTPGSKMPLQVMSDKAERDALVAYLKHATASE